MTITPADARSALADIGAVESRGLTAHVYRATSSILLLWGAVWIVAYTAIGLLAPEQWPLVWGPADLVGLIGTVLLLRRPGTAKRPGASAIIAMAVVLFVTALYVTNPPRTVAAAEALPPLAVALMYVVLGATRMQRFCVIGAALFALTLLGFFAVPHFFAFWMAAVGGTTLLASGAWLRQA